MKCKVPKVNAQKILLFFVTHAIRMLNQIVISLFIGIGMGCWFTVMDYIDAQWWNIKTGHCIYMDKIKPKGGDTTT